MLQSIVNFIQAVFGVIVETFNGLSNSPPKKVIIELRLNRANKARASIILITINHLDFSFLLKLIFIR